jgi:hypothetical protein
MTLERSVVTDIKRLTRDRCCCGRFRSYYPFDWHSWQVTHILVVRTVEVYGDRGSLRKRDGLACQYKLREVGGGRLGMWRFCNFLFCVTVWKQCTKVTWKCSLLKQLLKYHCYLFKSSSSLSSWLQIRRPGFDSRHYQKKKVVGLERGPLSLVITTEELLDRKLAAPV